MYKQILRYIQLIAKIVSIPFILAGVILFIIPFLPTAIENKTLFWIFISGGLLWLLDVLWGIISGALEVSKKIKGHRIQN